MVLGGIFTDLFDFVGKSWNWVKIGAFVADYEYGVAYTGSFSKERRVKHSAEKKATFKKKEGEYRKSLKPIYPWSNLLSTPEYDKGYIASSFLTNRQPIRKERKEKNKNLQPGFYWHLPLGVGSIETITSQEQVTQTDSLRVQVPGTTNLVRKILPTIHYQVTDAWRAYTKVDDYNTSSASTIEGILGTKMIDLVNEPPQFWTKSENLEELASQAATQFNRTSGKKWGVHINKIFLTDTVVSRSYHLDKE